MNIICAYQYSGSFWIRYIVEYISKYPTLGVYPDHSAIGSRIDIGVHLRNDIILYERSKPLITEKIQKSIYLVRNYTDVYIYKTAESGYELTSENIRNVFNNDYMDYISILREYKKSKANKILVYYEDLIQNPKVWITKILDFLLCEYKQDDLDAFFKNYDKHLKACYAEFKKTHNYNDNDVVVLKNAFGKELRADIDNMLIYCEPILFSDYLTRYIA